MLPCISVRWYEHISLLSYTWVAKYRILLIVSDASDTTTARVHTNEELLSVVMGHFIQMYWLCFYQTRSAWSMDQISNKNHSPINNFTPTVTKFCVMWEGQALPHDTKFGNCRDKIVDSRAFLSWSLIHGSSWPRLIKAEPGGIVSDNQLIFTCVFYRFH